MSAYVVDKEHVDALVTAAVDISKAHEPFRWMGHMTTDEQREARVPGAAISGGDMALARQKRRVLGRDGVTPSYIGAMLWAENIRSVNFRYAEDDLEQVYEFTRAWRLGELGGVLAPLPALFRAIDCYEYQACETPDWRDTEAHSFCHFLRRALINRLPGMQDAAWGWDGAKLRANAEAIKAKLRNGAAR